MGETRGAVYAPHNGGFVLVATLWMLSAIVLATGFFAIWTQRVLDLAVDKQAELRAEIEMNSTRSAILYLLATRPKSYAGVVLKTPTSDREPGMEGDPFRSAAEPTGPILPLDDSPCFGFGDVRFSVQDERGLVGLNGFQRRPIERLLGLLGVRSDQQGPLLDKLLDYIDPDDLRRLNGAETETYSREHRPPPPNRFLITSREAANVLGWSKVDNLWDQDHLPRLTTVACSGVPNFNLAPLKVLQTIPGIDHLTALRMIESRKKRPFREARDIYRFVRTARTLNPLEMAFWPSPFMRLRIWPENGKRMKVIHVRLTPMAADSAPWEIDHQFDVPFPTNGKDADYQTVSVPALAKAVCPDPK
jgi:general secretion pathway protein K